VLRRYAKRGPAAALNPPSAWWGAARAPDGATERRLLGFERANGSLSVYGDYLRVRRERDTWFEDLDVSFFHRNLEAVVTELIESGFQLEALREPAALAPEPADPPEAHALARIWQRVPLFAVIRARRPATGRGVW